VPSARPCLSAAAFFRDHPVIRRGLMIDFISATGDPAGPAHMQEHSFTIAVYIPGRTGLRFILHAPITPGPVSLSSSDLSVAPSLCVRISISWLSSRCRGDGASCSRAVGVYLTTSGYLCSEPKRTELCTEALAVLDGCKYQI